jgi:hypothetical protein
MAMETSECCSSYGRLRGPAVHTTSATLHPSPWATSRELGGSPGAAAGIRRETACPDSTAIFAKIFLCPSLIHGYVIYYIPMLASGKTAPAVSFDVPGRPEDENNWN